MRIYLCKSLVVSLEKCTYDVRERKEKTDVEQGRNTRLCAAGANGLGWLVLHPKTSYLVRQAIFYAALAVVFIGFGAYVVSQSSFAFGPIGIVELGDIQTWHYIDEAILAIVIVLSVWMMFKNLLDINTVQHQVLVLMPEGFLLKTRGTEQCVSYAGVASIAGRASRYGNVTLNVKPVGSTIIYKVQLDGRYGNAGALASQIVGAQRQYAARQRPATTRPQ